MKLDAQVLGVVGRREALDAQKLASRIEAGHLIETVSGERYRVVSKIAGRDGIQFRLSTPVESFNVNAAQLAAMEPLPRGLLRFARTFRVLAHGMDFDAIVKEAIRKHRLPVDPAANWNKQLWTILGNPLRGYAANTGLKVDEQDIEETLLGALEDALFINDNLSRFKPSHERGKKETKKQYTESTARQVTKFLSNLFQWEKRRAWQELLRSKHAVTHTEHGGKNPRGLSKSMEQPSPSPEGDEVQNILDTEEHATPSHEISEAETWREVADFRKQYSEWLREQGESEIELDDLIEMFDIMVDLEQQSGHLYSEVGEARRKWMEETGKSRSSYDNVKNRLIDSLIEFVHEFPHLLETSMLARLIADTKAKKPTMRRTREKAPVAASLRMAAAAPSDLAAIPGDQGRMPHDDVRGNSDDAVVLVDEPEQAQKPSVAPEIPGVRHGI